MRERGNLIRMEREGKGREGLRRGPEAIQKNDAKKKGKGAEKMQAGQGALRTPTGLLGRLSGMRGSDIATSLRHRLPSQVNCGCVEGMLLEPFICLLYTSPSPRD